MRVRRLILGVLVLGACREASNPAAPDGRGFNADLQQVSQDTNPSQMAVAQVVPGFGGYFLDAAERPAVYLQDAGQRATAEQALATFLASRGFTASDLQVLQGTYEYAQLDAWYRQARPGAFAISGIILGDVDEGHNRLRFGVADAGAVAGVRGVLAQLGIPAGAAIVEQRAPIVAVATLRDRVRPLVGGLQINFFASPVSPVTLICTLGFNALRNGVPSFITNSHCSNVEGGTETPTDYYQNLRSGGAANFIGTEVDDPQWTSQANLDCPPPFACRYSDASRAQLAPGVEFTLGRIARIDEVTTSLDDQVHTIAGFFTIKGERADPVQGEIANKVGRTTGWTLGPTTETCVDVLALGTTHIRLCQAIVSALVDGGDSGSNVFWRRGTGSNVTLLGILWGGSVDEQNPEFVYSPMSGIERELGALTTH
ncbi:MAG TPA: hypothetical protein VGQ06_07335 [Gemmatimonadales bacterium]|jgi:hypothetical protein|nr:hypothetical protein [Gemmatimonadales bacterium]